MGWCYDLRTHLQVRISIRDCAVGHCRGTKEIKGSANVAISEAFRALPVCEWRCCLRLFFSSMLLEKTERRNNCHNEVLSTRSIECLHGVIS